MSGTESTSAVEVIDTDARLRELSETIHREHELAYQAGLVTLEHAIAAGDALMAAQRLVPVGEWAKWVEENTPSGRGYWACQSYMRLAALKVHVDPDLSIGANLQLLRGMEGRSTSHKIPDHVRERAVHLAAAGEMSLAQIAREAGVDRSTVRAWVNPEWAREKEQRRRSRSKTSIEIVSEEDPAPKVAKEPDPTALGSGGFEHRARKYGEPGKGALSGVLRKLAQVKGREASRDVLLDLAAVASAWAETMRDPAERDAEIAAEFAREEAERAA